MLTRHRDELLKRLERVEDLGSCEIKLSELKRWYGRERLTKAVWADLLDRWAEVEEEAQLLIGHGEGVITLLYNDGLTPTEESWWEDLRNWAGVEIVK